MRLRALALIALGFPLASYAPAQSVISTHSGLINYSEGLVFLDGQPLAKKFGSYERLKNGSTLVTESGRAEVLLTPNTYLRIGENSSIRMVSDNLSDTQVEILAGSSMLDSQAAPAGDFVKLIFKDSTIRILKPGRYRVDAEPAQLRVFEGEAEVARDGKPTKIEASQLFPLDGAPVVRKFTEGSDGLLDIWSDERHSMIASNLASSRAIGDPLTDNGSDLSGDPDYLSYIGPYGGYIPMASMPAITGGYYGGGLGLGMGMGYGAYGFPVYGFTPFGYNFLRPYSGAITPSYSSAFSGIRSIYTPRASGTVFGVRPSSGGALTLPRPGFAPRPASPGIHVAPHVGGGRR